MTAQDKSGSQRPGSGNPAGSENLLRLASQWRGAAPVEKWDPPYCGEMDMRIAVDGRWYHEGTQIQRQALVQLFSSILRREADGHHYLVTPAEKVRIQVDDCPFVAVLLDVIDRGTPSQILRFTLNTGETVDAGPENPLQVDCRGDEEPHPVLEVRRGLKALISRSVFYDLVSLASLQESLKEPPKAAPHKGSAQSVRVLSKACWFVLGRI